MTGDLTHYLKVFKSRLKIDSTVRDSVVQELCAHLEDRSRELTKSGFGEKEATKFAMQALGPPEVIAQRIYETHAQGSWPEAFLCALPHFLVAMLFASYCWQNSIWLSSVLMVTVGVAMYGWHQGKPIWFFPWLGYYLLPVIISGMLVVDLTWDWGWIPTLVYIPLVLFVLIYIVRQAARRDGLYVSLMLAPVPVVFSWLLLLGTGSGHLMNNGGVAQLQAKVPWIFVSFAVLGMAAISFVRFRRRQYKTVSLLVPPIAIPALVILASRGI